MKHLIYQISMALLVMIVSCQHSVSSEIKNDESENWEYTIGYKRDQCGNDKGDVHYFPQSGRFDEEPEESNQIKQPLLTTNSQSHSQQFNEFAATMGFEDILELSENDRVSLIHTVATNSTYSLDFMLAVHPHLMD